MPKALATYFATVNDMPDTEFKVEILEDGPVKKVSVNGKIYDVDYNVGGDSIHSIILNRTDPLPGTRLYPLRHPPRRKPHRRIFLL